MTLDTANPLVIYDVHTEAWDYVIADKERYARLMSWAREQGLDPDNVYRLELYLIDCPHARVFEWALNEKGNRYFDENTREAAKREPYSMIVSSLPPDM